MLTSRKGDAIGRDRSLSTPLYFLYHTRFCLYTHFIRHIRPAAHMTSDDGHAIQKCAQAARDFLALYEHLGPVQRDHLRYSPGLMSVTASFCASFILRAIAAFPRLFEDIEKESRIIRKISTMMVEFGQGLGRGILETGETLLRSLDRTLVGRSPVAPGRASEIQTPHSQEGGPSHSHATFDPLLGTSQPYLGGQFPFGEYHFFDYEDWGLTS